VIPLAQTLTAVAEAAPISLDGILSVVAVVSLIWGAWAQRGKWTKEALLRAAIVGVKAGLDSLSNRADAEIVKQRIEAAAGGKDAPLNLALKAEVKKTTQAIVAYRDDGLPHLGILFFFAALLLGAGGCVSAAVHNSAVVALDASKILRAASVPDPRYTKPEEVEAWKALWAKQDAALRAIAEETK